MKLNLIATLLQIKFEIKGGIEIWSGRRDSNTSPALDCLNYSTNFKFSILKVYWII